MGKRFYNNLTIVYNTSQQVENSRGPLSNAVCTYLNYYLFEPLPSESTNDPWYEKFK